MKIIFLFLIFILLTSISEAQVSFIIDEPTIPNLLNKKFHSSDIKNDKLREISLITSTYYNTSFTTILRFNSKKLKVNEQRIDNGKILLNQNLYFNKNFDIIKATKFHRQPDGTSVIENVFYYYEGTKLVSIELKCFNKSDNMKYQITCDSLGNPIEQISKNSHNQILGIEKASFDYNNNQYKYFVFNPRLDTVANEVKSLHAKSNIGTKFNEYGDIVYLPLNTNEFRYYEYQYDDKGNWIEKKEYGGNIVLNGKMYENKLLYSYLRKIKYKN